MNYITHLYDLSILCCIFQLWRIILLGKRLEIVREKLGFSKKDFAEQLEISQNAYTNYIQDLRQVPTDVLVKLCRKFNVSINWFFIGSGNMFISSSPDLPVFNVVAEAISVSNNENEVIDHIKKFTVEKLFDKIFKQKDGFWTKLIDTIFPLTQRMIVITYKILKHISKDENIDINNSKEYLIDKIQNLDTINFENFGITPWDKQKLISVIDNMSEEECRLMIEDTNRSLEILRQYFDFLNKITFK